MQNPIVFDLQKKKLAVMLLGVIGAGSYTYLALNHHIKYAASHIMAAGAAATLFSWVEEIESKIKTTINPSNSL